jgi:hypothetical protein
LRAWLAAVRKSGLDKEFSDKTDGLGVVCALAKFIIDKRQRGAAEPNLLIRNNAFPINRSGA